MPTFPFLVADAAGPLRARARRPMQARSGAVQRSDRRNARHPSQLGVDARKAQGAGKGGQPRRIDGGRQHPGDAA